MKYISILLLLLLLVLNIVSNRVNAHSTHSNKQIDERLSKLQMSLTCDECTLGASLLENLLQINKSTEDIVKAVAEVCIVSKAEKPEVCEGILTNYLPIIIEVVVSSELNPMDLCTYFKLCNSTSHLSSDIEYDLFNSQHRYQKRMPKNIFTDLSKQKQEKLPFTMKNKGKRLLDGSSSESNIGYFLQIADIHYDADYQVGSDPDCGMPLCCRNGTGSAGQWGDYLCDLPFNTVQAIFEQISAIEDQLDFILWTGDNPPHNVWDPYAKPNQIEATQVISALVLKSFPNTPVFPSMGNHESFPSDEFYLPNHQWLLDVLYDAWEPWLDSEALQSVQLYGFYTALVKPGLRVVSLNTLDGDMINFYNLLPTKAVNQTAWFYDVLEQAETAGESVIIIGHIPCTLKSGVSDLWCNMYQGVMDRFSSIISAQIYGHTHDDQLSVFTDSATHNTAIGVQYIAPSVTTYQNHDPAYRVYEYDYTTNQITNYYQYHANLTETNLTGKLNFTLTYTAKDIYNMPDLSPQSWFNVVNEFRTNDEMFADYYNYITNHPNPDMNTPCNDDCRAKIICEILGTTSYLFDECLGV